MPSLPIGPAYPTRGGKEPALKPGNCSTKNRGSAVLRSKRQEMLTVDSSAMIQE